ncbi:hypothetical protein [Acidithiobacillus ferrooxidans]|uniref:hypothetical protein n=1 Tax=Acidithiobacillus ferrooxidans TaxID=920 RepID=UPI0013D4737E|nr:hypothetical protein [Acidithiobacillus ferrooxidans]
MALEAQAAMAGSGDEQSEPVVEPGEAIAAVSTFIPPQGGITDTAKEWALKDMPQAWRERIIADAADFGIRADGDTAWLLIGSYVRAWAAAGAAGDAAIALQSGVAGIPNAIWEGTRKATGDISGALRAGAVDYINGLKGLTIRAGEDIDGKTAKVIAEVNDAANAGAEKIRAAALTLTSSLDKAVKAKADEGVHEWAKLAVGAGQIAARTALGKATRNAAIAMGFLFILGVCAGAFGLELIRNFDGDYLPAGLRIYQAPGGDTLRVDPRKMLMQNAGLCGHDVCVPLVKNVRQPGQPAKP